MGFQIRGTFGMIGPRYEITDHSVVISRRWFPIILVPGIPFGIWLGLRAFQPHLERGDGKLFIVGAMGCIVLGLLGLLASPLRPPHRIAATKGVVMVGGKKLTAEDVSQVAIESVEHRGRYGNSTYHYSLAITTMAFKHHRMKLQMGGAQTPIEVTRVGDAVRALLDGKEPPIRLRAIEVSPGRFEVDKRDAALARMLSGDQPEKPSDWVPRGTPVELTESITEPMWRGHLASGRELERAKLGPYTVVVIETDTALVMKYRYRLFLLREGSAVLGDTAVLAVNLESSPFGTSAIGVHRGSAHINFGEAAPDLDYAGFRARARAALAEILKIEL